MLQEELEGILERLPASSATSAELRAAEERYRKSFKIALRWIRNYTELDFLSLGSYTRADLDRIAASEDAF